MTDPEQVAKIADRYIPRHPKTKTPAQTAAFNARQKAIAAERLAKGDTVILTEPERRKLGRPSKYRPEYCETVVRDAEQGYSLTSTATLIGVAPLTLREWEDRYPDFASAVARAKSCRLRRFEAKLIHLVDNGGDSAQLGAVKFAMTNVSPEDWKERFESTSNVNVSLSSLITDAMKTIEHEATQPKRLAKPEDSDD